MLLVWSLLFLSLASALPKGHHSGNTDAVVQPPAAPISPELGVNGPLPSFKKGASKIGKTKATGTQPFPSFGKKAASQIGKSKATASHHSPQLIRVIHLSKLSGLGSKGHHHHWGTHFPSGPYHSPRVIVLTGKNPLKLVSGSRGKISQKFKNRGKGHNKISQKFIGTESSGLKLKNKLGKKHVHVEPTLPPKDCQNVTIPIVLPPKKIELEIDIAVEKGVHKDVADKVVHLEAEKEAVIDKVVHLEAEKGELVDHLFDTVVHLEAEKEAVLDQVVHLEADKDDVVHELVGLDKQGLASLEADKQVLIEVIPVLESKLEETAAVVEVDKDVLVHYVASKFGDDEVKDTINEDVVVDEGIKPEQTVVREEDQGVLSGDIIVVLDHAVNGQFRSDVEEEQIVKDHVEHEEAAELQEQADPALVAMLDEPGDLEQ